MPTTDRRVDAYIARAAAFAQPVLRRLRKLVHRACPDVVETIKWGMPAYEYHGILCGMASFKAHATFGFWKGSLLSDPTGALKDAENAMGSLGRITASSDLPPDPVVLRLIRQAAKLNEQGIKVPRPVRKKASPPPPLPAPFRKALGANAKAAATFRAFSPSHRKEYIEWIAEAKLPATREKRVATAIGWLNEGKSRNWKYEKKTKGRKP